MPFAASRIFSVKTGMNTGSHGMSLPALFGLGAMSELSP